MAQKSPGIWPINPLPYYDNSLSKTSRSIPWYNTRGSSQEDPLSRSFDLEFKGTISQDSNTSLKVAIWRGYRVAVKTYEKSKDGDPEELRELLNEIQVLKKLGRHPHILTLFQAYEAKSKIFIIMEYTINGNLLEYLLQNGPVHEEFAKRWFAQIVDALSFCHHNYIAHREVKCENILFDSRFQVRLTGFGFASPNLAWADEVPNQDWPKLTRDFVGPFAYNSPEILNKVPYSPILSDIWSAGTVLFAMIYAKFHTFGKLLNLNGRSQLLVLPRQPPVSQECLEVFNRIFQRENERIRAGELAKLRWFKSLN